MPPKTQKNRRKLNDSSEMDFYLTVRRPIRPSNSDFCLIKKRPLLPSAPDIY